MKIRFLLLTAVFCSTMKVHATNHFQTLYGDLETDRSADFTLTTDGGYCIVGSNSAGTDTKEVTVFRLDSAGSLLWSSKIGSAKDDDPRSIIQTSDGGFVIAGNTQSGMFDTLNNHIFVMKIDDQGFPWWSEVYGNAGTDEANTIIADPYGTGFYVVGSTTSYGNVNKSAYIMKISDVGQQQWATVFNATDNNSLNSAFIRDGKILATGYSLRPNSNDSDLLIVQIDTSGNIDFGKRYSSTGSETGYMIRPFTGGGFITAGLAPGTGNEEQNISVFNADGSLRWTKNFGRSFNDLATSVTLLPNNHLLIGGRVDIGNPSLTLYQLSMMECDTTGTIIWAQTYGDPSANSEGFNALPGANGGFVCAGYSVNASDPNGDCYFVKAGDDGLSGCYELPSTLTSSTPAFNDSTGIDSQSLILDEGVLTMNWQFFINQFTQNCFSDGISTNETSDRNLLVFPNPATSVASVRIPQNCIGKTLTVFDSFGRLVAQQNLNEEENNIQISNLAAGIYSLRIQSLNCKLIISGK